MMNIDKILQSLTIGKYTKKSGKSRTDSIRVQLILNRHQFGTFPAYLIAEYGF